ncbi:MAG: hypothetical protein KDD11_14650, partial [Acidobacteria bacterium]|nr:hypothetical protein [Acidobacteriota bacterium]
MPDSRPTYSGENEAKRGFWTSYSWVFRLFASATSVLAGLIAFGFFSEAALYEMAGLPRLSADPEYLAEAGARGLVSSLAAIGIHGTIVLLLLLAVAYLCWSVHEHPYPSRWLRSPGLLVAAQSLVLAALTTLVIVLVSVAGLGTARGRDQVERQVLVKVGELRDRSDWTPALERNVTEEMRMAPTPVAHWYLRLGELLRHGPPPWPRDVESEATPPSLGFPLRPTDTLRRQARSFYGWLVVAAIALPGIVILLWRWRTWAAAQVPLLLFRDTLRQRLPTWWKRRYSTAELPLDPELRL